MIKSCIVVGRKITEETISSCQLDIPPFTLCNEWNTLSDIYIIIIPSQTTCNEFPFSVSHSSSDHFKNTSYPLYLTHQHFHLCLTFQTLFSLLVFFIASSYSQLNYLNYLTDDNKLQTIIHLSSWEDSRG